MRLRVYIVVMKLGLPRVSVLLTSLLVEINCVCVVCGRVADRGRESAQKRAFNSPGRPAQQVFRCCQEYTPPQPALQAAALCHNCFSCLS